MTYICKQDYAEERKRPRLLTVYHRRMVRFLCDQYPDRSLEEVDQFVQGIIKTRFKAPVAEVVVHKSEGNSQVMTLPLDKCIKEIVADNNLTPSGSLYMPVSRKESYLRISIQDKINDRNAFKKLYLQYEAEGQKQKAKYYNHNQANAKIFNNAIAGGMKIAQFILSSKAGFNAITSMGRLCVKQGYSFIERAINGNLYLPTTQAAITYIYNHVQTLHKDFGCLITQGTLYIPSVDEVVQYLAASIQNYVLAADIGTLTSVVGALSDVERSYVFYAGCFNNLCRYNEQLMRGLIDKCFVEGEIPPEAYRHIELDAIKNIKGDVVNCVLATRYGLLGLKPGSDKKYNSTKDAAANNPEGLKAFTYCCQHFVDNFQNLIPILKPILQIETSFSKLIYHQRMARYTVPLSDTDSNIYSTQELIRWRQGKIDFGTKAYEMNALVTFILSQSLEHVFARLSAGFGVEGKDVFRISMKNEFFYPILISTALAKHYLAIATMQEGSLLPDPRKDIKGVGFRSSVYPSTVKDSFLAFIPALFKRIETGDPMRLATILEHVASVEREIYTSLKNRETDYLQTISIKLAGDYADANNSNHFYYEMWRDVFAADYGEMQIPNKCYKVPLKTGKKLFKNPEFLANLKATQPKLHDRLVRFLEAYPKRDITAILLPPFKGKMHPFFLEIMDIRSHISQVMAGYYHLLNGLGIGTVDGRAGGLVSDFYDPSQPLLE